MYDLAIIERSGRSFGSCLRKARLSGCGCFRERADGWRTDDLYAGS